MKNKLMKIILLIATLLIFFSNSEVYADGGYGPGVQNEERQYEDGLKDPTINPNSWKPFETDEPELLEKAGKILGIVNIIGVVAAVIALSIMGIKYMLGSVEEKAEYKQELLPYITGAGLVFVATTLPNIIFNITKGLF